MKKGNLKSIEKARKAIRSSIEDSLSVRIKESITSLGYDPKKVKKEIAKTSMLLAKRIAEKMKITKANLLAIAPKSIAQASPEMETGADDTSLLSKNGSEPDGSKNGVTQVSVKRTVKANSKVLKPNPDEFEKTIVESNTGV